MASLREQTRRFWVTAIFLFLGPGALALISWHLYARANQNVPVDETSILSSQLGCKVVVGRREYLSPGLTRFINVQIYSRLSSDALLVCPELYVLQTKDNALLAQLANSIDSRRTSKFIRYDREEKEETDELQVSRALNSESNEESLLSALQNGEFRFSESSKDHLYDIVVVPDILVDASKILEIRNVAGAFFSSIFHALTPSAHGIACFAVNRIILFKPEEYANVIENVQEPTAMTKKNVFEIVSTSFRQTPRGVGGITETSIRNEVLAFSTEPISISMTRALYVESENEKQLHALFELQKISCPDPCYFSLKATSQNRSWSLRSEQTPLPGTFLSLFTDSFNFLQDEGWFSGRLDGDYEAAGEIIQSTDEFQIGKQSENRQTTCMTNCSFKRFDLRQIATSFGISQFSGLVTELTVRDGIIQDGTIEAKGSIRINEGTLPAHLVSRLTRLGKLEVSPANATKLRFINNATPFNKLEIQFALGNDGLTVDSNYSNKIVAFYEQEGLKYGFYLPQNTAGKVIPYAEALSDLYDSNEMQNAWKPFTKYVLSHVSLGETRSNSSSKGNPH